jgi:hypothetical protein
MLQWMESIHDISIGPRAFLNFCLSTPSFPLAFHAFFLGATEETYSQDSPQSFHLKRKNFYFRALPVIIYKCRDHEKYYSFAVCFCADRSAVR